MFYPFECRKCKSDELSYVKYVECKTDVTIQPDDCIAYGPPQVDETNELGACSSYVCRTCGQSLWCASSIETEQVLRCYLQMTPEERKQRQDECIAFLEAKMKETDSYIPEDCLAEQEELPVEETKK